MVRGGPGIRYFPAAHVPRSVNWHRSEQNGRHGFFSQAVGWRQIGQVMVQSTTVGGPEEKSVWGEGAVSSEGRIAVRRRAESGGAGCGRGR